MPHIQLQFQPPTSTCSISRPFHPPFASFRIFPLPRVKFHFLYQANLLISLLALTLSFVEGTCSSHGSPGSPQNRQNLDFNRNFSVSQCKPLPQRNKIVQATLKDTVEKSHICILERYLHMAKCIIPSFRVVNNMSVIPTNSFNVISGSEYGRSCKGVACGQ